MTEDEKPRFTQRRRPRKGPLLDSSTSEKGTVVENPPSLANQGQKENNEPTKTIIPSRPIVDTSSVVVDAGTIESTTRQTGQTENETSQKAIAGSFPTGYTRRETRRKLKLESKEKKGLAKGFTAPVQTELALRERTPGKKKRSEVKMESDLSASLVGEVSRAKPRQVTASRLSSLFGKPKQDQDEFAQMMKLFKQSSALTRLSLRFFRNFLSHRAEKYEKLESNLKKSKLPYSAIQYLSTVMFISVVVAIVVGVFVIVFASLLGPFWILPVVFGVVSILAFAGIYLNRPSSIAKKRKKDIDAKIPMAIGYIATMASADMPIDNIMYELGQSAEYGEVSREAKSISMASRFFGRDIISAMREGAKNSPSPKFAEFLQGIVTTVTSGGNLKEYFKTKAVQYQSELSTLLRTNAESIGILAESYVTVGVAFPLMLIVILGVVASLQSGSSGMIIVLYLIDLMIIPLITVTFAFLVSSTIKEVNL